MLSLGLSIPAGRGSPRQKQRAFACKQTKHPSLTRQGSPIAQRRRTQPHPIRQRPRFRDLGPPSAQQNDHVQVEPLAAHAFAQTRPPSNMRTPASTIPLHAPPARLLASMRKGSLCAVRRPPESARCFRTTCTPCAKACRIHMVPKPPNENCPRRAPAHQPRPLAFTPTQKPDASGLRRRRAIRIRSARQQSAV